MIGAMVAFIYLFKIMVFLLCFEPKICADMDAVRSFYNIFSASCVLDLQRFFTACYSLAAPQAANVEVHAWISHSINDQWKRWKLCRYIFSQCFSYSGIIWKISCVVFLWLLQMLKHWLSLVKLHCSFHCMRWLQVLFLNLVYLIFIHHDF